MRCAIGATAQLQGASDEQTEQNSKPKGTRFDPAKFLEIAAKGRTISTHRKKEIIFSQGDAADAVILHKERHRQSLRNFQRRQGSGCRHFGGGRVLG